MYSVFKSCFLFSSHQHGDGFVGIIAIELGATLGVHSGFNTAIPTLVAVLMALLVPSVPVVAQPVSRIAPAMTLSINFFIKPL